MTKPTLNTTIQGAARRVGSRSNAPSFVVHDGGLSLRSEPTLQISWIYVEMPAQVTRQSHGMKLHHPAAQQGLQHRT